MVEERSIEMDLGRVFIPCRIVLEMEAITSLYLELSNYSTIKEVPEGRPSAEELVVALKVKGNVFYERVIDYFINTTVAKIKPIAMYARKHHDRYRMGNVLPYAKTRVCLYLALHRLKVKFLIIKDFIQKFKNSQSGLDMFFHPNDKSHKSVMSALYNYFTIKNRYNLELMLPKEGVSDRVKSLIDNLDSMTRDRLYDLATYVAHSEESNIIKFMMRQIKASIFICRIMFAKMDVLTPFARGKEILIEEEEIMVSNDFLPSILPAMSVCFRQKNYGHLKDLFTAFNFMMNRVLDSINYAYNTASGGELTLGLEETLYNTGNLFDYGPGYMPSITAQPRSERPAAPAPSIAPQTSTSQAPKTVPQTPAAPAPSIAPQTSTSPAPQQAKPSSSTQEKILINTAGGGAWEKLIDDIKSAQNNQQIISSLGITKEYLAQFVKFHNIFFDLLNEASRLQKEGADKMPSAQEKEELLRKVVRWKASF